MAKPNALSEIERSLARFGDEENSDASVSAASSDIILDHSATGATHSENLLPLNGAITELIISAKSFKDFILTHFHVKMSVYKDFLKLDFGFEKLVSITSKE